MLHEIGHVLGFGGSWPRRGFRAGPDSDPYFNGPLALEAFNELGGDRYRGHKVPIAVDGHWRESPFGDEMMTGPWLRSDRMPLSRITIQSMADLGYAVDEDQADWYRVPPTSKPVAHAAEVLVCKAKGVPPGAHYH